MPQHYDAQAILDTSHDAYVVTTSLPYVNSTPHVGFAWEATIADTTARYLRYLGKQVFFLSGTDDNSNKITHKAAEVGEPTDVFVDRHAQKFSELQDGLGLRYDMFYRTYSEYHHNFVNDYVDGIDSGYITKQRFSSYFCADCESFVGQQPDDPNCNYHQKPYELIEEDDYFFRVDGLRDQLLDNIRNKNILPVYAATESIQICQNLTDFNYTRENKYEWGVTYKADPNHIFYSFPEALLGYLGGIALEGITLDDNVHVIQNIGRDILKFHSVYFPYLILAGGNNKTPDDLVVHGFINNQGQKMSKSKMNVVAVEELLSRFDKNAIRLYLLSNNIFDDFEFDADKLGEISSLLAAYQDNFAPAVEEQGSDDPSAEFHENMVSWQYHKNVKRFVQNVTEAGNINGLDREQLNFLTNFSKVFIV